jgi:hypothetical protein
MLSVSPLDLCVQHSHTARLEAQIRYNRDIFNSGIGVFAYFDPHNYNLKPNFIIFIENNFLVWTLTKIALIVICFANKNVKKKSYQ